MTEYIFLKYDGTWHRGIHEPEVRTSPTDAHRPITTLPACGIADRTPDAASLAEPPQGEPRHADCFA